MRQAKPRGYEQLDAQAVEFAGGVLEQPTGMIIGEQDRPCLTNEQCGVRRLRDNTLQGLGGMY